MSETKEMLLIAELMGWKKARKNDAYWHPVNSRKYCLISSMLYDKSWQWLIPAWSKLHGMIILIPREEERLRNDLVNFVDTFGLCVNKNDIGRAFKTMAEALALYNKTYKR